MKLGPYEVVRELGRGGMGVVYQGRSPDGRDVALKVLLRVDADTRARFARERRLIGTFTARDGFVPLLDSGESEGDDPRPFLVMPLLGGGTLRDRLDEGPLGVEKTVELGRTLAAALARAHEKGVVHRDLKPENILYDGDDRPLIADLGVAKHWDRHAPGASQSVALSSEGSLRGTPGYMALEQMLDSKSAGPSADVFALGAILHECLTGRPVFVAPTVIAVLSLVEKDERTPTRDACPDAPPFLVAAIERALARDAKDRFPHARALLGALRAPDDGRRQRGGLAIGAGFVGVAIAVLVAVVPRGSSPGTHASSRTPSDTKPAPVATVRSVTRAVSEEKPSLAELLERCRELLRKEDYTGVVRLSDEAVELDPRSARALATRSLARQKLGDYRNAMADATRAIELDPTEAAAYACRGVGRGATGDPAGGIVDLERAVELEPRNVSFLLWCGAAKGRHGDQRGAIPLLSRALEVSPDNANAWIERGLAHQRLGEHEAAIADISRAIELKPDDPIYWMDRGVSYDKKGDRTRAIADFTKATELDPADWKAFKNRATSYGKSADPADHKRAIADFTRVVELHPSDPVSWSDRGTLRETEGDLEGAIADASMAVQQDPRFAIGWLNRGVYHRKKGDRERAVSDFKRFLELEPGSPHAAKVRATIAKLEAGP